MPATLIGSTWIVGRNGTLDDDFNREYVRAFFVSTTDPAIGANVVLVTPGVPSVGDIYYGEDGTGEYDTGAVARRITARQDAAAPNLWIVEVIYSVKPLEGSGDPNQGNPTQQIADPLQRPVQWEISFQIYQRPVTEAYLVDDDGEYLNLDMAGDPIVEKPTNSATDPFDPPPMRDDARVVLTVTRYEPAPASVAVARAYENAVNSDMFFGAEPGQAQMKGIRARNVYEDNKELIHVTYEIHFREGYFPGDNWNLNLMDQGFNELVGGELVVMTDPNGVAYTSPQLLNGSGIKLDPPDSEPFYRRYQIYPKLPFAPLGLE